LVVITASRTADWWPFWREKEARGHGEWERSSAWRHETSSCWQRGRADKTSEHES